MALQDQTKLKQSLISLSESHGGRLPLDDAVLEALPPGTTQARAQAYGLASAWSFTARINALDENIQSVSYFLKYVAGDLGRNQLEGEFVGMTVLHQLQPELVPKPVARGRLKNANVPAYFLLIEFIDFIPGLPDPVKLGARLAALHTKSKAPNDHFGFHLQTYDGARLQAVAPTKSWTSFFGTLLAEAYRQDTETNGIWPQLEIIHKRVQSHLIPRLIGALEAEGRSVKPTLIHGDLWDGNIGVQANTGDPWMVRVDAIYIPSLQNLPAKILANTFPLRQFACAVYYAHNEMETGIWRAERHQLKAEVYRMEYLKDYEASEPKDEWDDRNLLYSTKTNFMHSACFAGSPARKSAFENMLQLVQKYVPWEEDSEERQRIRCSVASLGHCDDQID